MAPNQAAQQLFPNSFEAKLTATFWVTPNKMTWHFELLESGNDPTKARATRDPSKELEPPHYLQPVIAALLELGAIEKKFEVHIQYLWIEPVLLVSYDVIRTNNRQLSSATINWQQTTDRTSEELIQTLYTALAKQRNMGEDVKQLTTTFPCWSHAGFIDHDIEVTEFSSAAETTKLAVKLNTTYRRHPYGEFAALFALPRFPKADAFHKDNVAMAGIKSDGSIGALSGVVLENMRALETAMGLPIPKIVFIQGEPGSGKEGFARAIHFGSHSNQPHSASKEPEPVIRSVAGMTLEELRRALYGEDVSGGLHDPGLIDKAANGTLFLDEFDKLHKGDNPNAPYSELLRVWEANEFMPVSGRSVCKADGVNWIVAGAFTSERRMSDLPPDVWSRINASLSIKSPLSAPWVTQDERAAYVRALILNFMLTNGLKRVGADGCKSAMQKLRKGDSRQAYVVDRILFADPEKAHGQGQRLRPSDLMVCVTNALAMYIGDYRLLDFGRGDKEMISLPPSLAETACFDSHTRELSFGARTWNVWARVQSTSEHDSIRAIRQACTLAFERLYEFRLQGLEKKGTNEGAGWVKKMLYDVFVAIDGTRKGSNPNQFISREHLEAAFFNGSKPLVDVKKVGRIVEALLSADG